MSWPCRCGGCPCGPRRDGGTEVGCKSTTPRGGLVTARDADNGRRQVRPTSSRQRSSRGARDKVSVQSFPSQPVITVKIFTPTPTCLAQVSPPPVITVKTRTPTPTRPGSPAQHEGPALPAQLIQVGQPSDLIHLSRSDPARHVSQQPQDQDCTQDTW